MNISATCSRERHALCSDLECLCGCHRCGMDKAMLWLAGMVGAVFGVLGFVIAGLRRASGG